MTRLRNTLISAAENSHATPAGLQGAREFFHDWRLACSADGKISDTDHETTERALPQDTLSVQEEAQLHNALIDKRERIKDRAENARAEALSAFENHVDRELLQIFARS